MRITIEPTFQEKKIEHQAPKVIMEQKHDDLTIQNVLELFKSALSAYGYSQENIDKIIYEEDKE